MAKDLSEDYERLIAPIEDRMIRIVWRIIRDPDDAEDAFQDAMETIWKKLAIIRKHPNPQALILRICINSAYTALRRQARHRGVSIDDPKSEWSDKSPSPAIAARMNEDQDAIHKAIAELAPKQAEAVVLRLLEGCSFAEIGDALNCTETTARSHVFRARQRLQKLLTHLRPTPQGETVK